MVRALQDERNGDGLFSLSNPLCNGDDHFAKSATTKKKKKSGYIFIASGVGEPRELIV